MDTHLRIEREKEATALSGELNGTFLTARPSIRAQLPSRKEQGFTTGHTEKRSFRPQSRFEL